MYWNFAIKMTMYIIIIISGLDALMSLKFSWNKVAVIILKNKF